MARVAKNAALSFVLESRSRIRSVASAESIWLLESIASMRRRVMIPLKVFSSYRRSSRRVPVLGVVGMGVFAWEPLYDLASRTRELIDEAAFEAMADHPIGGYEALAGHPVRGFIVKNRWTDREVYCVGYYLETGTKAVEGTEGEQLTVWAHGGTLVYQMNLRTPRADRQAQAIEAITSPPWWGNVTDQATPSMPAWMKDDEQWQAALDAQD